MEISNVEAGLQTVGWLQGGVDGTAAAAAAPMRDVEVIPLNHYGSGRAVSKGVQLGFAAVDSEEIRRGVRERAAALSSIF
ncbi:MAG: hypothetical protein ABI836_03475 [Gemmatimonadota bacterium]